MLKKMLTMVFITAVYVLSVWRFSFVHVFNLTSNDGSTTNAVDSFCFLSGGSFAFNAKSKYHKCLQWGRLENIDFGFKKVRNYLRACRVPQNIWQNNQRTTYGRNSHWDLAVVSLGHQRQTCFRDA